MYLTGNFCRTCLQEEKELKDITTDAEAPDNLYAKFKICVSEMNWNLNINLLMCKKCISKLNAAFDFKCQCIRAIETLKSLSCNVVVEDIKTDSSNSGSIYKKDVNQLSQEELKILMVNNPSLLNQQLLIPNNSQNVIISSPGQSAPFPNLYLNLIPTNLLKGAPALTPVISNPPPLVKTGTQVNESNQNMFVNFNNTLHRLFPVIPTTKDSQNLQSKIKVSTVSKQEIQKQDAGKAKDVSQILHDSNSEELSVEIDPTCFNLEEENSNDVDSTDTDNVRDWEDVIVSNKITSVEVNENRNVKSKSLPTLNKILENNNGSHSQMSDTEKDPNISTNSSNALKNQQYMDNSDIPLGIKAPHQYSGFDFEEQFEIFNAGHFLTREFKSERSIADSLKFFSCELCANNFETLRMLNSHVKRFHLGKFPYRCKYCYMEFALADLFKEHLHLHLSDSNDTYTKDSITLEDLNSEQANLADLNCANLKVVPSSQSEQSELEENVPAGDFKCQLCPRTFNSDHGLSRHRVRKHNLKTKKKYFIKGMKNARCDICNREFSTQSYLQLHIKLHYRKNVYRQKVFQRDNYAAESQFYREDGNMVDDHMVDVDIHTDEEESFNTEHGKKSSSNSTMDYSTIENNEMPLEISLDERSGDITSPKFSVDEKFDVDNADNNSLSGQMQRTDKNNEESCDTKIGADNFERDKSILENNCKAAKEELQIMEKKEVKVTTVSDNEEEKQKTSITPYLRRRGHITDTKPNVLNDDVTVSDVGIKLKINLRNIIKQNSRDENDSKFDTENTDKGETIEKIRTLNRKILTQRKEAKVNQNIQKHTKKVRFLEPDDKDQICDQEIDFNSVPKAEKLEEEILENNFTESSLLKNNITISKKRGRKRKSSKSRSNKFRDNVAVQDDENIKKAKIETLTPAEITQTSEALMSTEEAKHELETSEKEITNSKNSFQEPEILNNTVSSVTDNCSADETTTENETIYFSGVKIEIINGKPKCNFCNKLFSRKHDLKRHMNNIHLKAIQYKCHLCDFVFYEAFHLTRHLRQHKFFLTCVLCSKTFASVRDLHGHKENVHDGNITTQCGSCGSFFTDLNILKEHVQQHDKEVVYKCHICPEEFKESRELTKHLVGHSGMYSCNTCQAVFATEHELTLHLKQHSSNVDDERNYQCAVCHNRYKKKRYLNNHIKHAKHFVSEDQEKKKEVNTVENREERHNSDDST